ncbi:GTP-binding protein [Streptomyces botrytidirepellens]|uniref:ATP-binding protein n=1 Tax=Streptomyces botrytidirepellens TaxID=2486417 RepID=A0A3M8X4P2_9ACTN|nr:ATP/GTP-binding protein [Streptomyces botrytidirepellens]RNG37362.1 ATP-binding protein [Streptomyces botrytidirepellens]
MAYASSEPVGAAVPTLELKIVVAGGFGVGKTTMVATLSEIKPLTTEEVLTDAGRGIDDLSAVENKTTTTVAMDFGRITFHDPRRPMILFLFGAPGQERFWFTWPDLSYGAVGVVVLADTRRLEDSFAAVNYFEQKQTPFVVAVNEFDGAAYRYSPDEVRQALELTPQTPVITCDVRQRTSARDVLIALVEHSLKRRRLATSGALT